MDATIRDFERAKAAGFVGMMMPGNPHQDDYNQPEYDALWQCAVDLDLPICFHILPPAAACSSATRGCA